MSVTYRFNSLEDFLVTHQLSIDGGVDDGWGASYPIKGREIEATVLFADIPAFTRQTKKRFGVRSSGGALCQIGGPN